MKFKGMMIKINYNIRQNYIQQNHKCCRGEKVEMSSTLQN